MPFGAKLLLTGLVGLVPSVIYGVSTTYKPWHQRNAVACCIGCAAVMFVGALILIWG